MYDIGWEKNIEEDDQQVKSARQSLIMDLLLMMQRELNDLFFDETLLL